VNPSLIRSVWNRANMRCEYCHMPASGYQSALHVDHIVARQHGGETDLENLALACVHCNQSKGPNIAGRDPETGEIVRLFHPRRDRWRDHFEWNGPDLIGKTQVGRVTIHVLAIGDPILRAVRAALLDEGIGNWD
jgi:HNH endonuclease